MKLVRLSIRLCRLATTALLLGNTVGFVGASDLPTGLAASRANLQAVLKYLRPALISEGGAGRLYYSTDCSADDGTPLPFHRLKVQAPSKGETGLAAVRDIFNRDERVTATRDRSGMIRISVGKPSLALLQTRIRSLTLTAHEQYNPGMAVAAVSKAKEVETAERKLGVGQPLTVLDMLLVEPAKGLPHLPASIGDITLDQAFDLIAKTFGGMVLYGACADSRGAQLVTFDYVGVVGVDAEEKR